MDSEAKKSLAEQGALPLVPRTMSTQHPDNVASPFFIQGGCFRGDDEIKEAYYIFSHMGCREQMWDCEGKEVNEFVVKELLSRYTSFFERQRIGRDVFITLRVPNPAVECDEAKILLETLESIPRSYDTARVLYGDDGIAPIFEVILPMTTRSVEINRIWSYYRNFVVGKEKMRVSPNDIFIKEWIGEFRPRNIQLIPLVEDLPYMLRADEIAREYLQDKYLPYMRIFLGRSDPALNYGMLSAVLAIKIALRRLWKLEREMSIPLYPIIGVGSCPFRGNFTPLNAPNCLRGYPSAQTLTIQSAFKYDYEEEVVRRAVADINQRQRGPAQEVDEGRLLPLIDKFSKAYREQLFQLVPLVRRFARYIPRRRMRKLHIGLFGYSRELEGVSLPRVITFCAALYSVGLPPELLGFDSLSDKEWDLVRSVYGGVEEDLAAAASCYNPGAAKFLPETLRKGIARVLERLDYGENSLHREYTSAVLKDHEGHREETLPEKIMGAAKARRFLG